MTCHDSRTFRAAGMARDAGDTLAPQAAPDPVAPPVHDARDLTDGAQTACIMLDGMAYTLRITRAGKLILTK